MIRLIQSRLIIPRGDTGSFSIPLRNTAITGDVAMFTIFDCLTRTKMYQKIVEVNSEAITIRFEHEDTVNLKPGKYFWDIKYYVNPTFLDGELVDGDEVDSYYAAFKIPECEIRETADNYLVSPDSPTATLSPTQLEIVTSALAAMSEAVEQTETNVTHYPIIIDEEWYLWDAIAGEYVDTGVRANGIVGNGIESAVLNADYTLTLNFTDGTSYTTPSIRGATGYSPTITATAIQGGNRITITNENSTSSFDVMDGPTGNGIADITLNADYTLTITYTDGTSTTTSSIQGYGGYMVTLSVPSYVFAGSRTKAIAGRSVQTKLTAYRGTEQRSVAISDLVVPVGLTVTSDNNITTPTLTITVASASNFTGGQVTFKATVDGVVFNMSFSAAVALSEQATIIWTSNAAPYEEGITTYFRTMDLVGPEGELPLTYDLIFYRTSLYPVIANAAYGRAIVGPPYSLKGEQGIQGPQGDAFHIVKTYASIAAMNADYGGSDVAIGEFVMIVSNVEDPDNAKVYVKGDQAYSFVVDMSGSAGIQGPVGPTPQFSIGTVGTLPEGSAATATITGTDAAPVLNLGLPTGATGAQGPTGNGIASITKTGTSGLVDTYTITYTNGHTTTFTVTNGAPPSLSIGTVVEGPIAAATITGTDAAPILNLTLPAPHGMEIVRLI